MLGSYELFDVVAVVIVIVVAVVNIITSTVNCVTVVVGVTIDGKLSPNVWGGCKSDISEQK